MIDLARQTYPAIGLAVYAYTPGGPVTLEIHTPDGKIYSISEPTQEACMQRAFPELFPEANEDINSNEKLDSPEEDPEDFSIFD